MKKEVIIEMDGICKSYSENGRWHHVLKNLGAKIYKGDFTVIMGASGEGKTTLIKILLGIETVNLGSVMVNNNMLTDMSEDERCEIRGKEFGYLSQKQEFLKDFSIYENIMIQNMVGKKNRDVMKNIESLMSDMKLDEKILGKRPLQLSGGELQRCALAKALAGEPEVLFMDEPTGKLNYAHSKMILDKLNEYNRKGQTMVMVTHDVYAAIRADRILYLADGKIHDEIKLLPWDEEEDVENRRHTLLDFLETYGW